MKAEEYTHIVNSAHTGTYLGMCVVCGKTLSERTRDHPCEGPQTFEDKPIFRPDDVEFVKKIKTISIQARGEFKK